MKYLTHELTTGQCLYFYSNKSLGEAIARHKSGQINAPNVSSLRAWLETLEKDESGQPIILPDFELDIQTIDMSDHPELEKQILEYIDQNGEDSIKDLVFNESDFTVSVNETAKTERETSEALDRLRSVRDQKIRDVDWLILRHQRENRLNYDTTLSETQIAELDNYIDALCDLPATVEDPMNPVWPEKPEFA